MANYRVTDTELASIANAIRTKGGTQAQLVFPTEFISGVENLPSGVSAADNGKVVVNGELVDQTSRNISTNGTYDTTSNDEVVINVSGGGGTSVIPNAVGRIVQTYHADANISPITVISNAEVIS